MKPLRSSQGLRFGSLKNFNVHMNYNCSREQQILTHTEFFCEFFLKLPQGSQEAVSRSKGFSSSSDSDISQTEGGEENPVTLGATGVLTQITDDFCVSVICGVIDCRCVIRRLFSLATELLCDISN